jgi:hypothetical protein
MAWLLSLRRDLLRGSIGTGDMSNEVIDKRIERNELHDVSHSIVIFAQAVLR